MAERVECYIRLLVYRWCCRGGVILVCEHYWKNTVTEAEGFVDAMHEAGPD